MCKVTEAMRRSSQGGDIIHNLWEKRTKQELCVRSEASEACREQKKEAGISYDK